MKMRNIKRKSQMKIVNELDGNLKIEFTNSGENRGKGDRNWIGMTFNW